MYYILEDFKEFYSVYFKLLTEGKPIPLDAFPAASSSRTISANQRATHQRLNSHDSDDLDEEERAEIEIELSDLNSKRDSNLTQRRQRRTSDDETSNNDILEE